MKIKIHNRKKFWIFTFIFTIGAILIVMQSSVLIVNSLEKYWYPEYEKMNIEQIINKPWLSDDDYDLIYRQTGLTKAGVSRCLRQGQAGKDKILRLQDDYFTNYQITADYFAPFCSADYIEEHIEYCYLEDGDILVTSATQFSGFKIGHAGLVTDAQIGDVLQANSYGSLSSIGSISDFTTRPNFMILSPKVDDNTKSLVAKYASTNLIDKPYDFTTGVLTDKYKCERTQCGHIVWYAYYQFGIDLDSNGGLVVKPKDFVKSNQLEVIQVYGFDLDYLWE